MSTKRWKVGLVGVGRGRGYGALFAADPRCEVVACCDVWDEALARFQRELDLPDSSCFNDYGQFLSVGMDVALIGSPMPCHAEQSIAAMEAGVNVLSEVAAATTIEECGRIVETTRRTGRTYMLAENCVYWPFVQEWKGIVQSGRLGEILYAECEYLHPVRALIIDPETGAPKWRAQRAPLHYCTHSLGPILQITQDRITHAMGLGESHRILPDLGIGTIDIQVGLFKTEKHAIIKLLRTSIAPREPALHFYLLQGTKGMIESDRRSTGGTGRLYVEGEMEKAQEIECPLIDPDAPEVAKGGGHGTAEYGVVQEFLSAMESGRKPALDEVRGAQISAPGLVAHETAMKGGVWLEVPSFE